MLVNNAGINYDTWETVENADIDSTVVERSGRTYWGRGAYAKHSCRYYAKVAPGESLTCHQTRDRSQRWALAHLHVKSRKLP